MVVSEGRPVFVHLLPALIEPGALDGAIAVVVDVLRATTVMVQALASGCNAVIPCGDIEEAKAIAAKLPAGTAILGGERQGLPIPGFGLGNSPGDFTPEVCRGKTLVITTTNGTRAILASREAERVLVAAFSNLPSTVAYLRGNPEEVHIVCAGTEGRISLEDSLLAGAIVTGLPARRLGNDEAEIVSRLWQSADMDDEALRDQRLVGIISRGRGGRRVRQIGLQADICAAATFDRCRFTARFWPDSMTITRE
jgi:2-phosphosulfolactate phosphatase